MCVRILYYTYTHAHACFSFQPDVRQEFWFVQRVEIQGFHLKSPCTRRCGRGRDLGSPNKFPGLNGLLVCLGLPGFAWVCPCPRACIPGPHPHNATLVSHLPPTLSCICLTLGALGRMILHLSLTCVPLDAVSSLMLRLSPTVFRYPLVFNLFATWLWTEKILCFHFPPTFFVSQLSLCCLLLVSLGSSWNGRISLAC